MVLIIDKIYIIWHKEDLKKKIVNDVKELFPDIPYELIGPIDGTDPEFPEWLRKSDYKVLPNWKQTSAPNPKTTADFDIKGYLSRTSGGTGGIATYHTRDHKLGELACGIAHYTAWYTAKQDNVERAIFFEQDAWLDKNRVSEIKEYVKKLEEIDYDFIYLGHAGDSLEKHQQINEWLAEPSFVYCLHAYLVTKEGIDKLVKEYKDNVCVADEYVPALFVNRSKPDFKGGHFGYHPSLEHIEHTLKAYCIDLDRHIMRGNVFGGYNGLVRQYPANIAGSGTEFSEYYRETPNIPVYVTTLNSRKDRVDGIKQRISESNFTDLDVTIGQWAKEGKDIDNKYLKDNKINIYPYWNINKKDTTIEGWFPDEQIHWFARDINKNEIGCALGHINMWKEAQQNEDDIAIFMEDDCWFSKNWQLYLRVALDKLKNHDWDIFYLYTDHMRPWEDIEDNFLVMPRYTYCTLAYVLNKKSINKLLESNYTENLIPLDEFFCSIIYPHPRDDIKELFDIKFNAFSLAEDVMTPSKICRQPPSELRESMIEETYANPSWKGKALNSSGE